MSTNMCVFAKHKGSPKEYIFSVPVSVANIRKGDVLLVETMRGRDIAIATTEIFEGRDLDEVSKKFGAYLPLKNVIQVCGKELCDHIKRELRKDILDEIILSIQGQSSGDELPF